MAREQNKDGEVELFDRSYLKILPNLGTWHLSSQLHQEVFVEACAEADNHAHVVVRNIWHDVIGDSRELLSSQHLNAC
jgi:hypothetical protein